MPTWTALRHGSAALLGTVGLAIGATTDNGQRVMDRMDEGDFETLAERALQAFARVIEESGADVDVELQGGILTLELADGRQYVINRHLANRQIWLSSPLSGARHYDPAGGRWRDTRDGSDLAARLAAELAAATGTPVDLG